MITWILKLKKPKIRCWWTGWQRKINAICIIWQLNVLNNPAGRRRERKKIPLSHLSFCSPCCFPRPIISNEEKRLCAARKRALNTVTSLPNTFHGFPTPLPSSLKEEVCLNLWEDLIDWWKKLILPNEQMHASCPDANKTDKTFLCLWHARRISLEC